MTQTLTPRGWLRYGHHGRTHYVGATGRGLCGAPPPDYATPSSTRDIGTCRRCLRAVETRPLRVLQGRLFDPQSLEDSI